MRQLLVLPIGIAALMACRPAPVTRSLPAKATPSVLPSRSPEPASAWHEDAPEVAFEKAEHESKLLLVDLWAPWCHTCLSMQAHVLDPAHVPELSSVVLLSIDTERESNAAFLAEYPIGVWPTFYLLDPRTRSVRGRWLGAATAVELSQWIRETSGSQTGAEQLALEADGLAAQKALDEAATRYRAALAAAPLDWPRRSTTLVSLLSALSKQKNDSSCLELAVQELANLPPSVASVDFASTALSCADRAPTDVNARKLRELAEKTLSRDCSSKAPGVAVDDQADACGSLRHAREVLGDRAGARIAAEQGLAVIEKGTAGAPPKQQAIYDWERSATLIFLDRSAEAEAILLERERQLPRSYNPSHYLARLYRDRKRWDEGLAAIERALAKAYGPRRIGFLGVKAELLRGKGEIEPARQVLEQQVAEYAALPAGQRQPEAEAAARKRLEGLSMPRESDPTRKK